MSWINIEERLPEYEQIVDLYVTRVCRDGIKRIFKITNVKYYPEMNNTCNPMGKITHWMPLSQQPK